MVPDSGFRSEVDFQFSATLQEETVEFGGTQALDVDAGQDGAGYGLSYGAELKLPPATRGVADGAGQAGRCQPRKGLPNVPVSSYQPFPMSAGTPMPGCVSTVSLSLSIPVYLFRVAAK